MKQKFSLGDAQVAATLATIAYAGDKQNGANPSIDTLHAEISHQLNCKPHYPTGTDWSLVWGPVETGRTDNLMYVAMNHLTGTMAIVLRGTTQQTLSRLEDIPRSFHRFPDPKGKARVSGPFLEGVDDMLGARDKWHGSTFADFYAAHAAVLGVQRVVVTGHSQGAALVPLMMLALQRGLRGAPKLEAATAVSGFAFAPPTTGSPEFAQIVDTECDCWFVINPKDIIPLGYNAMDRAITDGIPIRMEYWESIAMKGIIDVLDMYIEPTAWAQPPQQAILAASVTDAGLFEQIGQQHDPNTYLAKLGAGPVSVDPPSPFPVSSDPQITFPGPQNLLS